MDTETKELLEKTFALAEDNNKMLHHIRRSQRWASIMRALYWIIIIGVSVGSFYLIQPYVDQMQKFVKDSGVTIDKIKSVLPK